MKIPKNIKFQNDWYCYSVIDEINISFDCGEDEVMEIVIYPKFHYAMGGVIDWTLQLQWRLIGEEEIDYSPTIAEFDHVLTQLTNWINKEDLFSLYDPE